MRKSVRTLLLSSLVVFLLALGVFVLYSMYRFPAREVLEVFRRRWILANALDLFIDNLIPLQLTAVVLTFSLFARPGSRGRQAAEPFFVQVRPAVVLLLFVTLLYTLGVAFAEPAMAHAREDCEYRSALARGFLNDAEEADSARDWGEAASGYRAYLEIVPNDPDTEDRLAEAEMRFSEQRREERQARAATEEPSPPLHEIRGQSSDELIERAQNAMERGDFISAHYWAQVALQLDPNLTEAERILSTARGRMSSVELSHLEETERRLYERKREALRAREEGEIFRAYRILSELAEERPRDRDVRRYLPSIEKQVRSIAYFTDELEQAITQPGSVNIAFAAKSQDEGVHRRFISIERLVTARNGTYARGLELLDVDAEGRVLRHLQAPFGKLADGRFVLQGIDRGTDNLVFEPEYLVRDEDRERTPYVDVPYTARELHVLRYAGPELATVGIAELLMMERLLPRLGYDAGPARLALIMRLVLPFGFVILSCFAVSAGWAWRSRYLGVPPVPLLLLLPAIPFVFGILTDAYLYVHRVVAGAVLSAGGFVPAMVAVVVVEAILLLVSLAVLAGQSPR
ncbi:MAG: hypothetical protein ACLFM6_01330 [Spirochaetaceae bacterium]